MARIKIKDLPKDVKVTKEEMKTVMGGIFTIYGRPSAGPIGVLAKASWWLWWPGKYYIQASWPWWTSIYSIHAPSIVNPVRNSSEPLFLTG